MGDDDMEKEVTYSYTNVVREVSSPMKQSITKASKYRKSISMTFSPARHDSNAFKEELPQSKTHKDVLIFSPGRSHVSNEKGETERLHQLKKKKLMMLEKRSLERKEKKKKKKKKKKK